MSDNLPEANGIASDLPGESMLQTLELLAGRLSERSSNEIRRTQALEGRADRSPDEAFDRIARLTAAAVQAPVVVITLREGGESILKSVHGQFCPPDAGVALEKRVLETGRTAVVPDLAGFPEFAMPGARFYAGTPVLNEAGAVQGIVSAIDFVPRPHWREEQTAILEDAAEHVALELTLRTDVLHASSALCESEQRFRELCNNIPVGVYRRTGDGRILMANRAMALMLGFSSVAELMQNPYYEFREEELAVFRRRLLAAGEIRGEEARWRRRDGSSIFVRQTACTVRGPDGEVRYSEGVVEDITESSRISDALRATEARFGVFMDHTPVAAYIKDRSGRRIYVNRMHQRVYGSSAEDALLYKTVEEIFAPEEAARLRAVDEAVFTTNQTVRTIESVTVPARGRRDWLTMKFPFTSETGEPLLGGISLDITDQLMTERALRESEERFRVIAEDSSDFIVDYDLLTGAVKLYGAPDITPPQTVEELGQLIHPEDRRRVVEAINRLTREGGHSQEEFRVLTPDGVCIDLSGRATVLRDGSGRPYRFIASAVDITDRKRAEDEIARLVALVQSSADAIIGLSLEGKIQSWNRAAERILGYTAAAVRERPWTMLAPPSSERALDRILKQVRRGGSVAACEIRMQRSDGSAVEVSLSVSPVRTSAGELIGVSTIARDITDRKRAEEQLSYQVRHDLLTGLPNRRCLTEHLEQSIATVRTRGQLLALLYVDLDGFKLINDTFGHSVGDALLQQVAMRFEEQIREGDMLARMGGDEFMVLTEAIETPETAFSLAKRMLRSLEEPFAIAGTPMYVSASIGISLYPIHAQDAIALQKSADAAMYEAKRAGKNQVHFYMPQIGIALRERLDLGNELRSALERNEMGLEYQPQFSLAGRRLTGMEALLRWRHPRFGAVPPSKFIPIAEETGLILPVGEWVIERVCRDLRRWADKGRNVRVALNVSALQFMAADFAGQVRRIVKETGIIPDQLELELTESSVFANFEDAVAKMQELCGVGIKFALDDFGTGFSSLSYLQRLPISALKIDRSFAAGIGISAGSPRLIQAIVSLAHGLGLRVVIEGLETPVQLEAAEKMGCDEGQGYLLGRPGAGDSWLKLGVQ